MTTLGNYHDPNGPPLGQVSFCTTPLVLEHGRPRHGTAWRLQPWRVG